MATLAGNTIASTYALLLKIDNTGIAGDGTFKKSRRWRRYRFRIVFI